MSESTNATTEEEDSQPNQDAKERLEEFQSAIDQISEDDDSCGC